MFSSKSNKKMKLFRKTIILGLLLLFVFTGVVLAVDFCDNDIIQVQKDTTVKGPAFYAGQRIQIDGTIDGTTIIAGQEIRINGTINGDLVVAGQYITINGNVLGNVYSAAQDITIEGQVNGDALGAAQDITIGKESLMQRDLILAARKIVCSGQVQRQLLAAGQDININGNVNDDAKLAVENLELQDNAVIGGNLFYESPNQAFISGNANVSGKTDWKKTEYKKPTYIKWNYRGEFLGLLWGLSASLLIWFLVAVWRPYFWKETKQQIKEQPLKTLGIGALALIVTPILVIILMITVIGLPLGIILGLTYAVLIYLAKIIVAIFIGYWLAERFGWPELHKGVWLVLLGLAAIALLTKIPVLGFLLGLLVVLAGLGSVVLVAARPTHGNGDM